jgi:hypothetical protein
MVEGPRLEQVQAIGSHSRRPDGRRALHGCALAPAWEARCLTSCC